MASSLTPQSFLLWILCVVPTAPVAVGRARVLPEDTQNIILISATLLVVMLISFYFLIKGIWSDLWFKRTNVLDGFWVHILVWLIALPFAGMYARRLGFTHEIDLTKVNLYKVVLWSCVIVVIQDNLYFGFIWKICCELFNKKIAAVLVAILFTSMHTLFKNQMTVVFVAPGAALFSLLYYRFENVYLVSLAHTLFSLVAFYFGVFNY